MSHSFMDELTLERYYSSPPCGLAPPWDNLLELILSVLENVIYEDSYGLTPRGERTFNRWMRRVLRNMTMLREFILNDAQWRHLPVSLLGYMEYCIHVMQTELTEGPYMRLGY